MKHGHGGNGIKDNMESGHNSNRFDDSIVRIDKTQLSDWGILHCMALHCSQRIIAMKQRNYTGTCNGKNNNHNDSEGFLRFLPDIGELLHKQFAGLVDGAITRPDLVKPFLRLRDEIGRRCQQPASTSSASWKPWPSPPGFGRSRSYAPFACLSSSTVESQHVFDIALSQENVSKTLEGVSVYTVSNSGNEFVLISDPDGSKSLSLLCFRQQDAEALLSQVRNREPVLGREARVVTVPLEKVYKLSAEGIAFRFLPDPVQVKNAIEAKVKSGEKGKAFDGVPVFQSENLILRSNNRRYIPIFFRKEDLERALKRASKEQRSNPALKGGLNVQVGSFEDVLKKMEVNDEDSGWGDFIFVPPGRDAVQHLGKALG